MSQLPAYAQVVIWVGVFSIGALLLGFQLKTKFKASDTIYDGITADLRRVNDRVRELTEELQSMHTETNGLRRQVNELRAELTQTKARLTVVQDQVRRMGAEPIA